MVSFASSWNCQSDPSFAAHALYSFSAYAYKPTYESIWDAITSIFVSPLSFPPAALFSWFPPLNPSSIGQPTCLFSTSPPHTLTSTISSSTCASECVIAYSCSSDCLCYCLYEIRD